MRLLSHFSRDQCAKNKEQLIFFRAEFVTSYFFNSALQDFYTLCFYQQSAAGYFQITFSGIRSQYQKPVSQDFSSVLSR